LTLAVVYAVLKSPLDGTQMEQLAWTAQRELFNCVLLLHDRISSEDTQGWFVVYPDADRKPRIRTIPIPGPLLNRRETSDALAALAAEDVSGEARDNFDIYEELNVSFPGIMSRLDQVISDFADIAKHPDPEVRDLLPFYRDVGRYPLLTAEQERGEDLHGDERPPDGFPLSYQQWRLMMHNLRLVLWQARKVPRVGVTLGDLVQEGCFGLMTAVKRWDPKRGFRFATFGLWWVRQSMYRGMHNNCNLLRWPVYRASVLVPMVLAGNEDGLRTGEKPVKFLREDMTRLTLYEGCDGTADLTQQDIERGIARALDALDAKEKFVLVQRYGIGGGEERTLEDVGHDLNVSRQRIEQIQKKAMGKLRGFLRFELEPYAEVLEWRLRCSQQHPMSKRYKPYREYMQGQRRMYSEDN